MQRRTWGMIFCFLGICLLTGCGEQDSDNSSVTTEYSSTQLSENLTPTGYPSNEVQRPCVFYQGELYIYDTDGFNKPLEEEFKKTGMVAGVDNTQYPELEFYGCRVDVGQEIYARPDNTEKIFLKYENGYAVFIQQSAQEENLAEVPEEEESISYEKDGKYYNKVPDLISGQYEWASVLAGGNVVKDKHGCERIDHNSQTRSFEQLEGREKVSVRRWDNLFYSAGAYLIFEYNGTMHVSKSHDLYRPVLSYDIGGTYGIVTKVPGGYMIGNEKSYSIVFYNEDFEPVKTVNGYRSDGVAYRDGLMTVRDMQTGMMGYMDQEGNLAIPCQYGNASDFSNGYASVLTDAAIIPYTEDGGTVAMFYGRGGKWEIIDVNGEYVLEPSEKYANKSAVDTEEDRYYVYRLFTPVREDGTTDFISVEEDGRVLATVCVKNSSDTPDDSYR